LEGSAAGAEVHASVVDRRMLLAGGAAALAGPAWAAFPEPVFAPSATIRVAPGGPVPTLAAGLALAASRGAPCRILLAPGIYHEKLTVAVAGVTIAGDGPGVVVAHAAGAAQPRPDGGGNWGTSGSAILTVAASDVTLANLTIRNDYDFLAAPMQAVALKVDTGGDRCRILGCRVEGWQDTLLIQARTFIDRCRISGCVDFVFGGGAAWIGRSTIVSRYVPGGVGAREGGGGGFIAAPSTPAIRPYGLVFADCRLEREAGLPDGGTWLGRPWRAGGNMALTGYAAFVRCWMDAHIAPAGWTAMGYKGPDGAQRMLEPGEARLFEAAARGPGARTGTGRRQLSAMDQRRMTPVTVLDGWEPTTQGMGT